jgi:hypothetical protein
MDMQHDTHHQQQQQRKIRDKNSRIGAESAKVINEVFILCVLRASAAIP